MPTFLSQGLLPSEIPVRGFCVAVFQQLGLLSGSLNSGQPVLCFFPFLLCKAVLLSNSEHMHGLSPSKVPSSSQHPSPEVTHMISEILLELKNIRVSKHKCSVKKKVLFQYTQVVSCVQLPKDLLVPLATCYRLLNPR